MSQGRVEGQRRAWRMRMSVKLPLIGVFGGMLVSKAVWKIVVGAHLYSGWMLLPIAGAVLIIALLVWLVPSYYRRRYPRPERVEPSEALRRHYAKPIEAYLVRTGISALLLRGVAEERGRMRVVPDAPTELERCEHLVRQLERHDAYRAERFAELERAVAACEQADSPDRCASAYASLLDACSGMDAYAFGFKGVREPARGASPKLTRAETFDVVLRYFETAMAALPPIPDSFMPTGESASGVRIGSDILAADDLFTIATQRSRTTSSRS